jgi:replicative DNA helicase
MIIMPDHNNEPDDLFQDHPFEEGDPFERSAPHSDEAEVATLGLILLDERLLLEAIELLEPEDFYNVAHRQIFVAMIALFDLGRPITAVLIYAELQRLHIFGVSLSYLTQLTYGLPHANSVAHYADLIIGKSRLRQLVKAATKIAVEAQEEEDHPDTILSNAETAIYQLTETRYKTLLEPIDSILVQVLDDAEANIGGGTVNGFRTGLADLDQITSGFQNADLILLAARPGLGKTSEAVTIVVNAAVDYDKTVVMFSLEMSRKAVVGRMACNLARIDFRRFRNGSLYTHEWDIVNDAIRRLSNDRIFIDDKPAISLLEARAKIHRMAKQGRLPDLIVFDYLQLMTGLKEHRKESRQQ